MSQQYGPSGQGYPGPGPAGQPQGGWGQQPGGYPPVGPPPANQPPGPRWGPAQGGPGGPGPGGPGGPGGPFGFQPGQRPQRQSKFPVPKALAIGGAALAVVLVILGVSLLVFGGDDEPQTQNQPSPEPTGQPTDGPTPFPTDGPTTFPTPKNTEPTKGPNDVGVQIGHGIWFTPAQGWVKDPQPHQIGASYVLPGPGVAGKRPILGWFWGRYSLFRRTAKEYANHLVDIESNNLENVRIVKGKDLKCPSPKLVSCYAINYSAVVRPKGRPPVVFAGFVQAFQHADGFTFGSDTALTAQVYRTKYPDIRNMIATMLRSV